MRMAAGEFKAKCLKLMEDVNRLQTEIIITKFGKPVAKLVPVEAVPSRSAFGYLKGTVVSQKNLIAPTGESWEADA